MFDPLKRNIECRYQATLFPLGFELDLQSNDPRVVEAARQSWGRFEKAFGEPPLDLRIGVSPGDAPELPPEPSFHARGRLTTIVSDRWNFAALDYQRGYGFAWVTEPVVADQAFFRWYFLEASVYCLITERHMTPLHTGCIARGGSGLLLLGASGAGKSTLTFGCARHGWSLVGDDVVWLLRREEGCRVLGRPHSIRLRPDSGTLFPELLGRPAGVAVNGKPTVEINLDDFPSMSVATECEVVACVFLNRSECGQPALRRLTPDVAFKRITDDLLVYDEPAREEQILSIRRLAERPSYDLHYSDIDSAERCLQDLL